MKAKLIALVILLIPVGIFVYQNLEPVTVIFVRWSTDLPQALLLLIALVVGFFLGVIQMWVRGRRKRKQQKAAEQAAEQEKLKADNREEPPATVYTDAGEAISRDSKDRETRTGDTL